MLTLFHHLIFLFSLSRKKKNTISQISAVTNIEWQAPLSIISYPDPRLRAVNGRVGAFDDRLAKLAREMFDVMYDSPDDGVGLAAPQVGVNLRLMVFNPEGDRSKPEDEVVLVNPRIVSTSGPMRPFEEGCLSFPGIFGDVLVSGFVDYLFFSGEKKRGKGEGGKSA